MFTAAPARTGPCGVPGPEKVRGLPTDEEAAPALAERFGAVEQRLSEASSALHRSLPP